MMNAHEMTTAIQVSALTFRRLDLLAELVERLARLKRPEGFNIRVLVVDNDPEESARALVEGAASLFDGKLSYAAEPTPGIPAARNRAMEHAIASGATLLCFLDDDEIPDADWIEQLVEHWRTTGAALIGGPLHRTLPDERLPLSKWLLGKSLISRRRLSIARDTKAAINGRAVPVYTSNFMCDLSQIAKFDLRFEEEMQFSGGSDARFYKAVRTACLPTSWCPEAIVSEPIEPDRLAVGYQFRRSRSQGIVRAALSNKSPLRIVADQLPKVVAGAGLMLVPFVHPAAFAVGIDLFGSAIGHLQFLQGKSSDLYGRRAAR